MEKTAQQVLSHYYGYPSFRENQQEVIDTLLAGQDAFVLMPTGSGKSICYQIPSIMLNGVGLVVSPLIALMQDQVEALRQNGIRAAFLNSSLSIEEFKQVEFRVLNGQCDILYVAPERLFAKRFQKIIGKIRSGSKKKLVKSRWPYLPLTRPTACPSGAMISDRNISGWWK